MLNIAVFVSGGGTNLQALIDRGFAGSYPHGRITLVVSSSYKAYAIERAKGQGIPYEVVARKEHPGEAFDKRIIEVLKNHSIDLVVLAGYLSILGQTVTDAYKDRIINIHPALIPSFCGMGMYGLRVHEAVLGRGVKVTGATVHMVNEIPDGGEILLQKAVDVLEDDTPEVLQRRVMEQAEWIILPQAVDMMCKRIKERANEPV